MSELCSNSLVFLVLLLTAPAHANEWWDEECVAREKKDCGAETLPREGEMTQHQKDILACRLRALVKCMKEKRSSLE